MGNLQANGEKSVKVNKSPGKKNAKKAGNKLFGKGRKDAHFTALVPDESETASTEDVVTVPSERSTHAALHGVELPVSSNNHSEAAGVAHYVVSDSWKQINKAPAPVEPAGAKPPQQEVTPPSGESSSDSVFTDPLTSVGFSAEINQCYYSEESVNIEVEVPDVTADPSVWPLNNFKLNEYKQRRDHERHKKLGKLGVSRTSQISLDETDGCFVSGDVLIVENTMPSDDLDMGNTNNTDASEKTNVRRSSYYRPRKIELVSTRITPDNGVLQSTGNSYNSYLIII